MTVTYPCAVCGALALPTNSYLVGGDRFVHRACQPQAQPRPTLRHREYCYDDEGKLECCCGLDDLTARLTDRQLAQYEAGRQVFVDLGTGEAWL